MPELSHDKVIREYWESVKEQYPDIPFQEFEEICATPFRFVKFCMKEGELATIAIKYFGKFRVYPSKLLRSLYKLDHQLAMKYITKEEYDELKELKTGQLKNIRDGFTKKNNGND